jgi:hypothetical protein
LGEAPMHEAVAENRSERESFHRRVGWVRFI